MNPNKRRRTDPHHDPPPEAPAHRQRLTQTSTNEAYRAYDTAGNRDPTPAINVNNIDSSQLVSYQGGQFDHVEQQYPGSSSGNPYLDQQSSAQGSWELNANLNPVPGPYGNFLPTLGDQQNHGITGADGLVRAS
ncbi:hypothetical protein LTR86_004146 [Recurvomyces mirabilis]|nr:hypothetical protein LTR86_004146 [Recurvomyces mirabilis]